MTRRFGDLALLLVTTACVGSAAPIPLSNPVATYRMVKTFDDSFDGRSLNLHKWDEGKPGGTVSDRTLAGNAEREVYFDPSYLGLGVEPVTAKGGILTIEARPLTPGEKVAVAGDIASLPPAQRAPVFQDLAYSSGRISNRHSFRQTYGYFEMRARFDPGRGLWPAFWLLPSDGGWPPELDVMEVLGHEPNKVYSSTHSVGGATQHVVATMTSTPDGYHRYGMLWMPTRIEFFVDGIPTGAVPTPVDAHKPMYILVNLAVGGMWPGYPDATTRFPAHMDVDYVRAWRFPGKVPQR